jgi:hypothetical protein
MWLGAVYKTSRRQSFFVGVRRVSEQTHPRDNLIDPLCLCRAPMSLTHSEDECPGYQRQTFECPVCGGTMTQWKGVSSARCTTQRKRAANVGVGNPVGAFGCQSLSWASTGSNPRTPPSGNSSKAISYRPSAFACRTSFSFRTSTASRTVSGALCAFRTSMAARTSSGFRSFVQSVSISRSAQ